MPFINPTPAAEAKLLGEKVARNAAFREVRVQAIKRARAGMRYIGKLEE